MNFVFLRLRPIALLPILKRHFQRDFDRRRTVAGEEDVIEIAGREIRQPLGQPNCRVAPHAQRRAMGHAIELLANRGVDSRMMVAVDVAPHAAGAVEILAAVDVDQPAAFGPRDDERLVLRHLREGMPMVAAIPVDELVASGHGVCQSLN